MENNAIPSGRESGGLGHHTPSTTWLPEPPPTSPAHHHQCCSRTLKGESIRSLRELLRAASLSSSSSVVLPVEEEEKKDQQQPLNKRPENETAGSTKNDAAAKQHADEVRSRLLHNLGIQKPPPEPSATTAAAPSSAPQQQLPWGPSYTVPLNDAESYESNMAATTVDENDNGDNDIHEENQQSKRQQPPTRHLHFDPVVHVHPIPSFAVYSNRVRRTIWTGADELAENVARNSLEFSYEHWDAAQVLDEDGGLLYHQGEWIHPVHFDIPPPDDQPALSSDEIWKQTCERLGIQPAEYYHSIQGPLPSPSSLSRPTKP